MSNGDDSLFIIMIMFLLFGIFIGWISMEGHYQTSKIVLSQETADDICVQLTGNQSAVAKSSEKKLICKLPSFDSTQNIIIQSNQDE